jgi:hypothetical protein
MSIDVELAIKIGVLEGFLEVVESVNDGGDQDSKLISVLKIYRNHLRRLYVPLKTRKLAIEQAEFLLHKVFEDCPEKMCGWSVGLAPNNRAQQFANSLRRISLDLSNRH